MFESFDLTFQPPRNHDKKNLGKLRIELSVKVFTRLRSYTIVDSVSKLSMIDICQTFE